MSKQLRKVHVSASSKAMVYEPSIIRQGDIELYPAKQLHADLQVKTKFEDWIKRRIIEFDFKEGFDYFSNLRIVPHSKKPIKEYSLTLDMCKELGMVERTEIGRIIRKGFILAEKKLRGISQLPKESQLFKGLKPKRINGRAMYPYREILRRCGYSTKSSSSSRKARYWNHFVLDGTLLFITEEFATHLYHSRQVTINRATMLASQPVLPLNFGDVSLLNQGGAHV